MSKNRVIGNGGAIPWRIPDEFRWFRHKTSSGVVIMGRRTFESLPKPLEGRINVVLTRSPTRVLEEAALRSHFEGAVIGPTAHRPPDLVQMRFPKLPQTEVRLVRGMESLIRAGITDQNAWLCGGVQLYEQFLPHCSELFLSVIDREVDGDAFFPKFEHLFDLAGVAAEYPDFRVYHYKRNAVGRDLRQSALESLIEQDRRVRAPRASASAEQSTNCHGQLELMR